MFFKKNPKRNPLDKPKDISREELNVIFDLHEKWIRTDKKEGKQADLSYKNPTNYLFIGKDLMGVNFQGAYLPNHTFGTVDEQTDVSRANFQEADLRDSNFEGALGLMGGQFAGADLSGVKFPETFDFSSGLEHVEEICRAAKKIFISLILGCIFSWLTIGMTTDAKLLTNSASSPLPIIQTTIPIASFYVIAPVILFALFLYFHFYLRWLWDRLASFPAIFPNGNLLDEQAYPWLLVRLVRSYFYRLKKGERFFYISQNFLMIFLTWWLVPITMALFWWRYLPVHDWLVTGVHIILLVISIGGAILFQRKMFFILSLITIDPKNWEEKFHNGLRKTITAVGIGVIFYSLSIEAIGRDPFTKDVDRPFITADFSEEDVSTKPDFWTGEEEEILLVKRARLNGADLRFANGARSFLVKADLREADLTGADLREADLREALFQEETLLGGFILGETIVGRRVLASSAAGRGEANLEDVDFKRAKLNKVNFSRMKLRGVNFQFADLRDADLALANLRDAILRGADLRGADLALANLRGADLRGANLSLVINLVQEQINETCMDEGTKLPDDLKNVGCKGLSKKYWDVPGWGENE